MTNGTKNVAASVHARLLNRARAERRPFNELLQYYAMERFLYRLSESAHAERFVLKGALMLQFWGGPLTRSTKDIDLLGRGSSEPGDLVEVVRECLCVELEDDGLTFDADSVSGDAIRLAANYDGVRLRFSGRLGNARISLQVDVGFGDIITPGAEEVAYPTLLDFPAPRLLGYTPETAIAEKLQALVVLDMANTRLKDFLDIWILISGREFAGEGVAQAIAATFARRQTEIPATTPVGLTPVFHSDSTKQTQWIAFLRKARVEGPPPALAEVAELIDAFATPIFDALSAGTTFTRRWSPGGPWTA